MNTSKARGFTPMKEWNKVNWHQLERRLFKLQKRIYQASQRGDRRVVRRLQKTVMKSWSARMIAVRQVSQENKGKKTAGVDGIKSLTPKQRLTLVNEIKGNYRAARPTRRVWIPKPGKSEKRPLGIPVMYDRALQAVVKMALEPEWEAVFEPNSYGFRPGRSCHDAIGAIYVSINKKPKYVLDADISGCFDNINHLELLAKVNTYPTIRRLIRNWLKSGVIDDGIFQSSDAGTPQGGVISPLLANIALHGLEDEINKFAISLPGKKRSNLENLTFVRYADDFVILHQDAEIVSKCHVIISEFLKGMGLRLNPEKTKLTHTYDGFDFLGFNIRQYKVGKLKSKQGFKTFITPSRKSIIKHYKIMADIITRYSSAPQEALITKLNPIIRGWAKYYSTVVSKEIYSKIDNLLWNKLRRWAYRRHPMKPKTWIVNKYWGTRGGNNWTFQVAHSDYWLIRHNETPIVRHVKVIGTASPFDGNLTYWSTRLGKHPEMPTSKAKLLKKQKGKCAHCGLIFRDGDILETHHIQARNTGGSNRYDNLELLHLHCHDNVHGSNVNGSYNEEPDEVKISSPVLKTSSWGDPCA